MNYQYSVSAVESMFGGWAMLSEVHQERVAYLSMGWIIVVIGIVIMIPGIILKKKEDSDNDDEFTEDKGTYKKEDSDNDDEFTEDNGTYKKV